MASSTPTNIRLPNSLRDELRKRAAEEGMSVNGLILALLAGSIGFTLEPQKRGRPPGQEAGVLVIPGPPKEATLR